MTLDKYTQFQPKQNALFYGDTNGSYIMAEDINTIQDAVTQLEEVVGIHSKELSLSERIENMEENAALRADKFIVYQGNPLIAYETLNEAIHSFSFVEHLVLTRQGESSFETFIEEVIAGRSRVYGFIDCDSGVPLSLIQLDIEWWRSRGATGIFLSNFDYDNGNNRERQNDILLAVHERGLRAIITGDINNVLFNAEHVLNPEWIPLGLTSRDGYHISNPFIQSGEKLSYDSTIAIAKELIRAKESLNISIYVEDSANGSQGHTQGLYEHGHSLTLLFGLDGYFLNRTDYYQLNDPIRYHAWAPFLGSWGDGRITLVETVSDIRRRTSFGEIIYVKSSNTIVYTGLTIPPEILQWKDNSLPGTVIQDGTIPDSKIEYYDGDRLISSINQSAGAEKISLTQIEDIMIDGGFSVDLLKTGVIEAINKRTEEDDLNSIPLTTIDSRAIGSLSVDNMSGNVVESINHYSGHSDVGGLYIHGSIIDELDGSALKSGDIRAERMAQHVVEAINKGFGNQKIDYMYIGDLKADRIQAEVINAINLYTQSAVIDKAVINSAAVGELTAKHIEAIVIDALVANIGQAFIDSALIGELDARSIRTNVIAAIEANIGTAVIDSAVIGELNVAHMKGKVIEAINFSAVDAFIEGAKIKEASINSAHIIDASITNAKIGNAAIKTANIELGAVTSAIIGEGQVNTIHIAQASITDALVLNLSASKLNAGTINASLVKIEGENGHLRLWGNRLQVFDNSPIPIERVSLGDVDGDGSKYGFRVRGADGTTVLYDDKGVYNEGITDGAITNPKIGDDAVDGRVIKAESVLARHIIAEQILATHIATDAINARHILAGSITAASAIIANGAIGSAQIADAAIGSVQIGLAVIGDSHINDLNANKINAGVVKAQFVEIGGETSFLDGYDPVEINASLRNDLRLTSPLPTTITLSSDGIKATTASDPTRYAALDYRGLYVHNGAIVIEGGLTKDNMDSVETDKWDGAVQFSEEMLDDDVLTAVEKRSLLREWDGYQLEHAPIMTQADYYWPLSEIPPPGEKGLYVSRYTELNEFLNVEPDNNGFPLLHHLNIANTSLVVGSVLSDKISAYKNAKFELQRVIAQHAKDLADEAQRNIDEVEGKLTYDVDILSTNGNIFRNGQISTTLEAVVYYGPDNITATINASQLIWKRKSVDNAGDIAWNEAHSAGAKSITITPNDINVRATFSCDLAI